jgi:F-type H+-transporting ATPase subunit a
MIGLIVIIVAILRQVRPTVLEMVVTFLYDFVSDIMRRPADPFLPLLGSLALFIAIGNMIGLVPWLMSPTSDVNTTIALSLVVFFAVHVYGVSVMGFFSYLKSLASPVFLLPLEIVSQISRTISLSIRLFGNVVSAEIIIGILFMLVPLFVPLPLQGFSIFTGLLQAYIFTALASVYIASALPPKEEPAEIGAE